MKGSIKGGTTFRSTCQLCNDVFFSPQAGAPYCQRCARRIGYRPPRPEETLERVREQTSDRSVGETPRESHLESSRESLLESPSEPTPASGNSKNTAAAEETNQAADPSSQEGSKRDSSAKASSPRNPSGASQEDAGRAPASRPVTESLRRSIQHAYQYYAAEPDAEFASVLSRICEEFALDRSVVHPILAPLQAEAARSRTQQIAEVQGAEIRERYERMVRCGERPNGGRHRAIARELGITVNAVELAIGQWRWRHHDPRQLSREQKFQIEKSYWRRLNNLKTSITPERMAEDVAGEMGLPVEAVLRWLDHLHDDPRLLLHVAPVEDSLDQRLREQYERYLQSSHPPEESLHRTLASELGVSVRQAHRAVLFYRWQRRIEKLELSPDKSEMVRQCLSAVPSPGHSPISGQDTPASP